MAQYKCSGCGYAKSVPEELAGKRVKCPKCQVPNEIRPGEAQKAAAQPSQAAAAAKPIIKFVCPLCDQKLGVPAEYAGKKVRCNKCKNPVDVPGAAPAATPIPVATPPAPKPAPAAAEEPDMGFDPMAGMGDLLAMERDTQAVERPMAPSPVVQETHVPAAEPRQRAAKPAKQAIGGEKSGGPGGLAMAAAAVGGICSLVALVGVVLYLSASAKTTDFAPAERFATKFMGHGGNQDSGEGESENAPAATESNESGSDDSTISASERSHLKKPEVVTVSGMENYGPELATELAKEERAVAEYMNNHPEDASEGAMERLSPMTTSLGDFHGIVWKEPSLAVVRRAQCWLPDKGTFGFSLTYAPRGATDQQVVFILESKGSGFMLQGIRAKHTLKGWVDAMPPRAELIDTKTDALDYARRLEAMPKAYWFVGLPAIALLAVVLIGSLWVLFEKFEKLGTGAIVPVYNLWALAEVGGRPGWLSLLVTAAAITPMLGGAALYAGAAAVAVIMLVISLGVASECNKGFIWGIGAWLLPGAVYPLLAASVKED